MFYLMFVSVPIGVTSAVSCPPPAGAQSAIQSAWAGLAAGFLHTLCGPDHLAVSFVKDSPVRGAG